MTRDEAIRFHEDKQWEPLSHRQRAELQFAEEFLCMPFDVFHEAVEKALGRPVWTHEFALNRDGIIAELRGTQAAPSMQDIIELIPEEKRIVLIAPDAENRP